MTDEISIPSDVLFDHARALMLEQCDTIQGPLNGRLDYCLSDIEDYEGFGAYTTDDEWYCVFHSKIEGTETRRVKRATRYQPPEYETRTTTILVTIEFYPSRYDGLGGVDVIMEALDETFPDPRM